MITPIEFSTSRTIGFIESVSPNTFNVILESNSPHSIALNTGTPRPFPRLNEYLLVPNERGAVVGIITWIGIEQAALPKGAGIKDKDFIKLPFPKRRLSLVPIGNMTFEECRPEDDEYFNLERGISIFPSVGDPVILPTKEELSCIIKGRGKDGRVEIGTAPLAGNVRVSVDPDKLFGRHLAVLGNTGSGKSCSVAGLIRWSLEAAQKDRQDKSAESDEQPEGALTNARFIILDPNGEYSKAFDDIGDAANCRVLSLSSRDIEGLALSAPHWAWTAEEWTGILRTGPGFQAPVLRLALQQIKDWTGSKAIPGVNNVVRYLSSWLLWLEWLIYQGPKQYATFPKNKDVSSVIISAIEWLNKNYSEDDAPEGLGSIEEVVQLMESVKDSSIDRNFQGPYDVNRLEELKDKIIEVLGPFRDSIPQVEGSADRPYPFPLVNLATTIEMTAERLGGDTAHFTRTMLLRLHRFREDADICSAIDSFGEETLEGVLAKTFGAQYINENEANIVILNLSFVPRDVLHIVMSVLARIIFEALQWYRKLSENKRVLPTALILEEAHTFVQRRSDLGQDELSPIQMCRRTFERIAREGRKFGLGLVLSSQRPSEISPTVLAQCNTFLLHRIVNDRDQALVSRLIPDNLGGFLKDLPNLPTKQAILLGWATPLPVLVEMKDLEEPQRPQSDDPDFWDVWTYNSERKVDWEEIATHWQEKPQKKRRIKRRRRPKS